MCADLQRMPASDALADSQRQRENGEIARFDASGTFPPFQPDEHVPVHPSDRQTIRRDRALRLHAN
ncbi:hypothetical protein AQ610_24500 [Burkholderia humptydooensis]|nr:hypothetical protein AQ610_24500 [Burkholderia humptydooensis]